MFCQNYQISTERAVGKSIHVEELANIFAGLASQGAHNINLVNPTHFALPIAQALRLQKLPIPVVYNSGGYETLETLQMLDGLIDIYLPDFKYMDNELAKNIQVRRTMWKAPKRLCLKWPVKQARRSLMPKA